MNAAEYSWCPVCDCRADTSGEFVVLHGACWEALREALYPELPEAIAHIRSVGLTLPPAQVIARCLPSRRDDDRPGGVS